MRFGYPLENHMHYDNLTCEDIHKGPAVSSRVFHWEHLSQATRDHIQSLINGAIDNDILIDNLQIDYAYVPAPAGLALLGLGGVAGRRRRG